MDARGGDRRLDRYRNIPHRRLPRWVLFGPDYPFRSGEPDVHERDRPAPPPLVGVAGVWTGTEILMFGGQTESVNDVNFTLRFNPATGAIRNGTNLTSS